MMNINDAYKFLGLDINKEYTEEEVETRCQQLEESLSSEMLNNFDNEEISKQFIMYYALLNEFKKIVLEDINNRKENNEPKSMAQDMGIKPYEGIGPYTGGKPTVTDKEEGIGSYTGGKPTVTDKEGSKKNKIARGVISAISALLVVGSIAVGSYFIGKNSGKNDKKGNVSSTPTPTTTVKATPEVNSDEVIIVVEKTTEEKHAEVISLLEEIETLESEDKTSEKVLAKEKEMLLLAREIESYLTDEEKARIAVLVDDNYARGMNQVKGMSLSEEEGLIAVSYLNGLAPELTGANTDDITLDFILDFETYWNKLNYEAKKFLGAGIEIKGENFAQYGDLISDYVLNEKDYKVISHFISERLKVNNEAHNGKLDVAREMARKLIEKDVLIYTCFEDITIGNEKINVSTLTPWAQYLINFMAYADTGYLEDEAIITTINGCEIVNANGKVYHYDSDESFVMQRDARNNINRNLEASSINAFNAFIEQSQKYCKTK